ncbi:nuclear transport factor 2 family protein [Flavobacterium sp. ANB]|uniref:DUF4440 domain-containing protein n=1 Tax=unclassified Flavobacterium TaxID=196869 RepID=UPI0012B8EBA4|nr:MULTISPECIES: DUF4440 domain-containing protein [unclassified Flavobacterium]MBF4515832.1 nuclear transport factor 2 family protein [Flavobacterium sp. ANB]MTD68834.1 DUF4440 domain-containing protein [Flavobacterium sp. LC2016-13]
METQIIELEKKYWKGMENHEYETVKNLTQFPCIIASKNGVQSVDESKFKKMFESGDGDKIKVLNISDVETKLISENTAIIGYIIELGITDDKQNSPTKCACTSTWIKENDNWVCALHTEAELSQQ